MTAPQAAIQPAVLRERDAAIYVGLSRATLRNARQGKGDGPPFIRLGTRVRYRPADLDDWLLAHRIEQLTREAG